MGDPDPAPHGPGPVSCGVAGGIEPLPAGRPVITVNGRHPELGVCGRHGVRHHGLRLGGMVLTGSDQPQTKQLQNDENAAHPEHPIRAGFGLQ